MADHYWICRGYVGLSYTDPETGENKSSGGMRYHCATCWLVIDQNDGVSSGINSIIDGFITLADPPFPNREGCPKELKDDRFHA